MNANDGTHTENAIAPARIQEGNTLHERYLIQKRIGSGGMGEVFLATDQKTGRDVAVKRTFAQGKSIIRRFQREYRFLSAISHPHLIQALDYFEDGENHYIVLEYVEGKTLSHFLTSRQFSLAEKLIIANNIARATEVLNTGGVLHRDIKPSNIMLEPKKGIVKLLDLGIGKDIARSRSGKTMALTQGNAIGTFEYMSPQQLEGHTDDKCDIFSLGVTLYQFFADQSASPFQGKTHFETMHRVMEFEPPTLMTVIADQKISPEEKNIYKQISSILGQAMSKKDQQRLESCQIMADQFAKLYRAARVLEPKKVKDSPTVIAQSISPELKQKLREMRRQSLYTRKKTKKKSIWLFVAMINIVVLAGMWFLFASTYGKRIKEETSKSSKEPSESLSNVPKETVVPKTANSTPKPKATYLSEFSHDTIYKAKEGALESYTFAKSDSVTNAKLRAFIQIPGIDCLEELTVSDTRVTDEGFRFLYHFRNLEKLNLNYSEISDAGTKFLTKLPKLKQLRIEYTNVAEETFEFLERCEELEVVHLGSNFKIKNVDRILQSLAKLEKLEDIDVGGLPIQNEDVEHFIKMDSLQELNINRTQVTDEGLRFLVKMKNLEEIHLEETSITDYGLQIIARLKTLKDIRLCKTQVTNKGLRYLLVASKLNKLHLDNTLVSVIDQEMVDSWPTMKYLRLDKTNIDNNALKYIGQWTKLEDLRLSGTKIDDDGFQKLKSLKKLKELFLNETSITNRSISIIKRFKKLKRISIKDTNINSDGVKELKEWKANLEITNP